MMIIALYYYIQDKAIVLICDGIYIRRAWATV